MELVEFVIENFMFDTALAQKKIEMRKREEILFNHNHFVRFSEKETVWYTHLLDKFEKGKCTNIK